MGIDIYLQYVGMTRAEHKAQITGYSVTSGNTGYLREAYHGEPYATEFLVKEAFDDSKIEKFGKHPEYDEDMTGVRIPAKVLRERLPEALRMVEEREKSLYKDKGEMTKKVQKSFTDFVELAEKWEREGKKVFVYASY